MIKCDKCKRDIANILDDKGNWQTIDVITNLKHYLVCHPSPLKFKPMDEIIVWWPRGEGIYIIESIEKAKASYNLQENWDDIDLVSYKTVLWNKLEPIAKRIDQIYRYLYT